MIDADVAIVGAGGAGLTLLHELARVAPTSGRRWRVALVDDVDRLASRPDDRTWCFWDRGPNAADAALTASWQRLVVHPSQHKAPVALDLSPLRYVMLRGGDFYALVDDAVRDAGDALDVVHLPSAASVLDGDTHVRVSTSAGDVRARWVFDSRPSGPKRAERTVLSQQFRGVVVRTSPGSFDPSVATLMDFRTPQPPIGMSFGYCLPVDDRRALVEYTEFSPQRPDGTAFDAALAGYLELVLEGSRYDVEHTEQGAIPMTDAVHARRTGRRIMRIGTSGGATRPSTGYTFRAMQRQAAAVVESLVQDRVPVPPRAYPRRHALMDAALLRGLAAGHLDGPAFFVRLFERNPAPRVLDFLDGASGPASELALMATSPRGPMLRSVADLLRPRASSA